MILGLMLHEKNKDGYQKWWAIILLNSPYQEKQSYFMLKWFHTNHKDTVINHKGKVDHLTTVIFDIMGDICNDFVE